MSTSHSKHHVQKPEKGTASSEADHQHKERVDALRGTGRHVAQLLFGVGMGIGLPLSGMASPSSGSHFFDLNIWFSGRGAAFAPNLLVTFGTALAVHAVIYHGIVKRLLTKPIFGDTFNIPTNRIIDFDLISGAAIFGAGWALSGYCPGPAIAASFSGQSLPIVVTSFMMLGFGAVHFWRAYKQYSAHHTGGYHGLVTAIGQHGTLEYICAIAAVLAINLLGSGTALSTSPFSSWNPSAVSGLGGIIIGSTIGLAMVVNGTILGNAGIIGGLVNPVAKDKWIRFLFVLGSGLGSLLAQRFLGVSMAVSVQPSVTSAVGGFLVGVGSSLANGCTSGHGICGVTRLSPRSLIATATFFCTAIAAATLMKTSKMFF